MMMSGMRVYAMVRSVVCVVQVYEICAGWYDCMGDRCQNVPTMSGMMKCDIWWAMTIGCQLTMVSCLSCMGYVMMT